MARELRKWLRSKQNGKFLSWLDYDLQCRHEIYSSIQEAKKREKTLKSNPRMMFLFKKRALMGGTLGMLREVCGVDPTTCLPVAKITDHIHPSLLDKQVVRVIPPPR